MGTEKVCTNGLIRQRLALSSRCAALLTAGLIGSTVPAAAQTLAGTTNNNQPPPTPVTARLIEWDLPEQADNIPGAMVTDVQADSNRLWFVTRMAGVGTDPSPRVYRVDLHNDKKNRNTADWFSWELQSASNGGTSVANGLRRIRPSKDGRFVFVHTTTSVIRIDTQPQNCRPIASTLIIAGVTPTVECPRTTWPHDQIPQDSDHPANPDTGSDVTIDGNNNIFSAVAVALPDPINPGGLILAPERSFIQRLNTNAPSNNLTRFYVGGSAGFCGAAQTTTPCLSGVDVDRSGCPIVLFIHAHLSA